MSATALHRKMELKETQLKMKDRPSSKLTSQHRSSNRDRSQPARQAISEHRPEHSRRRTRRHRLLHRLEESAEVEKTAAVISNHEAWGESGWKMSPLVGTQGGEWKRLEVFGESAKSPRRTRRSHSPVVEGLQLLNKYERT